MLPTLYGHQLTCQLTSQPFVRLERMEQQMSHNTPKTGTTILLYMERNQVWDGNLSHHHCCTISRCLIFLFLFVFSLFTVTDWLQTIYSLFTQIVPRFIHNSFAFYWTYSISFIGWFVQKKPWIILVMFKPQFDDVWSLVICTVCVMKT